MIFLPLPPTMLDKRERLDRLPDQPSHIAPSFLPWLTFLPLSLAPLTQGWLVRVMDYLLRAWGKVAQAAGKISSSLPQDEEPEDGHLGRGEEGEGGGGRGHEEDLREYYLPEELWLSVFSYCDVASLVRVSKVFPFLSLTLCFTIA